MTLNYSFPLIVSCLSLSVLTLASLQANQKMSKAVLLKDLYAEIERMREGMLMLLVCP